MSNNLDKDGNLVADPGEAKPIEDELARIAAEVPDSEWSELANEERKLELFDKLLAGCEATLLFYSPDRFDRKKRAKWKRLTGQDATTSKVLVDTCRAAVAQAKELYG